MLDAYDLTAGGTVAVAGASGLHAYGNLYKTQECLSATPVTIAEALSDTEPLCIERPVDL